MTDEAKDESRFWRIALLVLVLLTIARVLLIDALADQGYFAKYVIFADRILTGTMQRDRITDLSPGYLWLIVVMRAIGSSIHFMRTLQIVLTSVAASFVAMAARRFGRIAAITAALGILGSRAALVCATELEPETFILALNAAALMFLLRPSRRAELVAGLSLGLSAICRPVAIAAAATSALFRRSWRIAVAAALPLILVLVVNRVMTGEATVMDPGTVFYEGMNPSATGYAGVQPRIVNDLERKTDEPDFLHVAYRIVASRAAGHNVSRAESNRYWTGKALAFARTYPGAALRLTSQKLLFALQSHDAWDLSTMAAKSRALGALPFLPFGFVVAFAGLAVLLLRDRAEVRLLLLFTLATGIVLVAFYVTARQRNAVLPPLAVLAGIGVEEVVRERRKAAAIVVLVVGGLLTIPGSMQEADDAGWLHVPDRFDAALTLEQQGRWPEADVLLRELDDEGYRPMRENRAVSSLAYYRAITATHVGSDPRPFVARAMHEAPGNEHVLGLAARLGDASARTTLFALHDPITAKRALAEKP